MRLCRGFWMDAAFFEPTGPLRRFVMPGWETLGDDGGVTSSSLNMDTGVRIAIASSAFTTSALVGLFEK